MTEHEVIGTARWQAIFISGYFAIGAANANLENADTSLVARERARFGVIYKFNLLLAWKDSDGFHLGVGSYYLIKMNWATRLSD